MKQITYDDVLIHVSGEYLTKSLPKTFRKFSEKKLLKFVQDHTYAPFEYYSAADMWDLIGASAESLRRFLQNNGIKVIGD